MVKMKKKNRFENPECIETFLVQQSSLLYYMYLLLMFCVFTSVAPTLFKILGTALDQSWSLDTLDCCCPSHLVFKVAVNQSSSAVRLVFTNRESQSFLLI